MCSRAKIKKLFWGGNTHFLLVSFKSKSQLDLQHQRWAILSTLFSVATKTQAETTTTSQCLSPKLNPEVTAFSTLALYPIRNSSHNPVFDYNYNIYLIRTTSPMAGFPQATGYAGLTHMQRSKLWTCLVCVRFFLGNTQCVSLMVSSNFWIRYKTHQGLFHCVCLSQSGGFSPNTLWDEDLKMRFRTRHSLVITTGRYSAILLSEYLNMIRKRDFQIQILCLVSIRSQRRNSYHPDICQLPDLWPLTSSPWMVRLMNWNHKTQTPTEV